MIRATLLSVSYFRPPHVTDKRAPVFQTCPEDAITFISDPMQETATVNWLAPSALDHSNNKIAGVYVSGPTPGSSLEGGSYPVVYVAEDASGNTANCRFTVVVSGNALTLLPTNDIGSFMLFHFHKHMPWIEHYTTKMPCNMKKNKKDYIIFFPYSKVHRKL